MNQCWEKCRVVTDKKLSSVIRKLKTFYHFRENHIYIFFLQQSFPTLSVNGDLNTKHGYPQSNAKAESANKTTKRLMRKINLAEQDPCLAILEHWKTPTQGLDPSPAHRLLSRTRKLPPIGCCTPDLNEWLFNRLLQKLK